MRKKRKGFFLQSLLTFQLILIIFICIALVYVHFLLKTYERCQPERLVEEAKLSLATEAENGTLWESYDLPEAMHWEANVDLHQRFAELLNDEGTKYAKKAGLTEKNESVYTIKTADGFLLAEITLQSIGDPVTKLAVFTWQEWELAEISVAIAPQTYTLTLPQSFTASVNGITLTDADAMVNADGKLDYVVKNLLFRPEVEILSETGERATFSLKGTQIIPVIYDYNLTLPASLSLTLDGISWEGEPTADGYRNYRLLRLTKPEVTITDLYGNTVSYEGENTLPLSYVTVTATDRHVVTVNGANVPDTVATYSDDPNYEPFAMYVSDLPRIAVYDIAVLENDAEIVIIDRHGNKHEWDGKDHLLDLTKTSGAETIPEDIAAEVDVLHIAKQWSLFVSNDIYGLDHGLSQIATYLIPSSYQYEIAYAYANGIDITFTSIHTLKDPPFTEERVTNYVEITENCFSVDVSFKKHMILNYTNEVIDTMNERLYFVKYDDPNNDWDTATWKLASMKEIVNAE